MIKILAIDFLVFNLLNVLFYYSAKYGKQIIAKMMHFLAKGSYFVTSEAEKEFHECWYARGIPAICNF